MESSATSIAAKATSLFKRKCKEHNRAEFDYVSDDGFLVLDPEKKEPKGYLYVDREPIMFEAYGDRGKEASLIGPLRDGKRAPVLTLPGLWMSDDTPDDPLSYLRYIDEVAERVRAKQFVQEDTRDTFETNKTNNLFQDGYSVHKQVGPEKLSELQKDDSDENHILRKPEPNVEYESSGHDGLDY